jgi:hypothetical protein
MLARDGALITAIETMIERTDSTWFSQKSARKSIIPLPSEQDYHMPLHRQFCLQGEQVDIGSNPNPSLEFCVIIADPHFIDRCYM